MTKKVYIKDSKRPKCLLLFLSMLCSPNALQGCRLRKQGPYAGRVLEGRQLLGRRMTFGRHKERTKEMKKYVIELSEETALFYQKIAETMEYATEQVLSDALFRFAGELVDQVTHSRRENVRDVCFSGRAS